MRYLTLPPISTPFSKIALGSTNFGTTISQSTAWHMLDAFFLDQGKTLDTARVYGQTDSEGRSTSERIIGQWIRKNGIRNQITLITKGLHPSPGGSSRFSYKNLMLDINRSREVLETDFFDLWFFHRDDPSLPVSEIMEMVAPLVQSGVIRALGASNWTVSRIEEANQYAQEHKLPLFIASEIQWSLATSTPAAWGDQTLVCMDETSLAWYRQQNMPVFAYSSQARGFFSKAIEHGFARLQEKTRTRFYSAENLKKLERVRTLATNLHLSPAAIVTAYITNETPSSVAIVGCSSVEQLKDTLSGGDVILTPSQLAFLNQGEYDAT